MPSSFQRRFLTLWLTLAFSCIFLAYFFQNSLTRYWQQTWRSEYPLLILQKWPAWKTGEVLQNRAEALHAQLWQVFRNEADTWTAAYNGEGKPQPTHAPSLATNDDSTLSPPRMSFENGIISSVTPVGTTPTGITVANATATPDTTVTPNTTPSPSSQPKLAFKKIDKVLFVGDSLMQGVAPHVQKALTERWQVSSVNLSKQSTGLAYPNFFDWPKTVDKAFEEYPEIGLVVVFLGANDPWDMPNPAGGLYLRFTNPDWGAVYRSRIQSILRAAADHQARTIWLEAPNMQRDKLNKGMHYLNTLYQSEAEKAQITYLPTNQTLGMQDQNFVAYADDAQGQKVRVRTNDGVHFTAQGQKLLAESVLRVITPWMTPTPTETKPAIYTPTQAASPTASAEN
jgi:hypothetical protein